MKEILITATALIIGILLIRRIFRGRISSRLQYALWLLVALRLLIPVSAQFDLGPLSGFRLMDLVEDESGISERLEETIRLEEPIQMTVDSRSILFRLFTTDEIRGTLEGMPDDGPTAVFIAGRMGFSWLDVLRFLWTMGMLAVGLWIVISNIRFSRSLRKTRQPFALSEEETAYIEKIPGQKNNLPQIYLAGNISSPCLYGLPGREAIYLTADVAEDSDKRKHVLVHELVHKKHGDSFWALLRGVLVTVYWFHPLVWVAAVCSKRDCELACDEAALSLLGENERIPYGETLLSIITKKGRFSDLVCTATTMTGSGKSVKERIRFIAEKPRVLYAAVTAALLLAFVVCAFVFTKNPQFNGVTIDRNEGLIVTGADMQIPLPASIGGISECVVDDENDTIVIYHKGAQQEVGRFSHMMLRDALQLVDEGREVVPIGDHGYNYLLRAYLGEPLMRIEHTYTPAGAETQGVLGHEDIYSSEGVQDVPGTDSNDDTTTYIIDDDGNSNPMFSTDWEALPLEEERDYLPNETIIIKDAPSVTMHTYTPADVSGTDSNEGTEAVGGEAGVPGTDSNDGTDMLDTDDTTYVPSEESVDYLPNETIRTTTYQPTEVNVDEIGGGCYVYVKADFYGKAKDSYVEEMAFIDRQLKAVTGNVIVLSLNRERREALFEALTENRTPYLGDNSKVGALLSALPMPPTLNRTGDFSLQTVEEPYSLRFEYEMSTDFLTQEDRDMLYFNAAMLFYAIGNVEEITIDVKQPTTYVQDSTGTRTVATSFLCTYMREEMERDLPALQDADFEDERLFRDGLSKVHIAVEEHLKL